MWTVSDLKKLLYFGQTTLGVLLLIAAWFLFQQARVADNQFVYIIPGVIVALTGSACLIFGIDTYILRDDPDIWR